jgi:glutathione S-transferase
LKLYYSPGACSLATRISLHEAGIPIDGERVDLKAKTTERGTNYLAVNPAGSVPMIVLDDDQAVTENVAILALIAEREPKLGNAGSLGRTRLLEMLSFLSTELHIAFKAFFHEASEEELTGARSAVAKRLDLLVNRMVGPYLFGSHFGVADAYLFVMLRWAKSFRIPLPPPLADLCERVAARDLVQVAIAEEEELPPSAHEPASAGPAEDVAEMAKKLEQEMLG